MKSIFFTIAIIAFGLCAFGQVNNGLIAKYSFNGNANDEAGNHNGMVSGAMLTTDRFGNANSAYHFNRDSTQYIEVPYTPDFTPGTNPMSISLWFLAPPADTVQEMIISWYRCGANAGCTNFDAATYMIAMLDTGRVYYDVRDDNGLDSSYTTSQTRNDNEWHHAVLIFDPTNHFQNNYLDDVLVDSIEANYGSISDGGVPIPLEFGRTFRTGWGVPGNYFTGKIDDIRIYNRILSALEVDSLYHEGGFVGISPVMQDFYFTLYPNPAKNILTLENNSGKAVHFTLYNSLGEKVTGKVLKDKKSMIDLSSYPADFYFYKLTSGEKLVKTGKVVKL